MVLIILDHFFHFGCKRRDDIEYDDEELAECEADGNDAVAEAMTDAPTSQGAFASKAKAIVEKLKVIFIPPKKEKRPPQHAKKKK